MPVKSIVRTGGRHVLARPFDLVVTALGLALLALGLHQWTAIAWGNDTRASRAPVAYAARLELPPEVGALPSEAKWIVLVAGRSAPDVCGRLAHAVAPVASGLTVGILVASGGVSKAAACSPGPAARGWVREVAVISRRLASIPSDGFIVTDRTGRVVYGSYDLDYLAHALPSLSLLD